MGASARSSESRRYELLVKIASGGTGTVYVGRLRGLLGFEQLVAIKRPHAHLLESPAIERRLLAEAKIASRFRHANVLGVRDVEAVDGEILLVMDYIEGASLAELLAVEAPAEDSETVRVGLRVVRDVCAGLQAVHDLEDEDGRPLHLVHRDVSPHNVLVGLDGVARLIDFGIAKSLDRNDQSTAEGTIKGKVAYMAPEYVQGVVAQSNDVFSLGVVLWELSTGRRLFAADNEVATLHRLLNEPVPLVSEVAPSVGGALDAVVARALERSPEARFSCAADLLAALEAAIAAAPALAATHADVARFVQDRAGPALAERRRRVVACLREPERDSITDTVVVPPPPEPPAAAATPPAASPRETRPRPRVAAALVAGVAVLSAIVALAWAAKRPTASAPAPENAPAASIVAASPPDGAIAASPESASEPSAKPAPEPASEPVAPRDAPRSAPRKAVRPRTTAPTKPRAPADSDRPFHNPY